MAFLVEVKRIEPVSCDIDRAADFRQALVVQAARHSATARKNAAGSLGARPGLVAAPAHRGRQRGCKKRRRHATLGAQPSSRQHRRYSVLGLSPRRLPPLRRASVPNHSLDLVRHGVHPALLLPLLCVEERRGAYAAKPPCTALSGATPENLGQGGLTSSRNMIRSSTRGVPLVGRRSGWAGFALATVGSAIAERCGCRTCLVGDEVRSRTVRER